MRLSCMGFIHINSAKDGSKTNFQLRRNQSEIINKNKLNVIAKGIKKLKSSPPPLIY